MELKQFQTADDFLSETEKYLERKEACNNVMLGIAYSLRGNPNQFDTAPFFAVVKHRKEIQLSAVMTPSFGVIPWRVGAIKKQQFLKKRPVVSLYPYPHPIGSSFSKSGKHVAEAFCPKKIISFTKKSIEI